MKDISLRQIEIFHAVMTTGNVTEAAALLRTSQPTVSRELARFEHQIRLTLFERVRGRLQPTAQGLQLFEEVQRSYYGLDRIISAADTIRDFHQAQLSLACLPAFSQSLLPAVCKGFFQHYPDVNLHIVPQESPLLEEWLSAQRYDLGLTEDLSVPAGTRQETVFTSCEVCVLPAGHHLLNKSCLTPADFAGENFISLSPQDRYRQIVDSLFHEQNIARCLRVETHSAASVCALVREGVGISIVNPLTALDYINHSSANTIHLRPLSITIPFTISLIIPLHRPSSALVDVFADHLRQYLKHTEQEIQKQITANNT